MYERMLNKQVRPTIEEMNTYCGQSGQWFLQLHEWMLKNMETTCEFSFPYGNDYGWALTQRKKKKLICHIFAEKDAFNVMIRLSNKQFDLVYNQLLKETQECIENKFPCGDGGWLHYRVLNQLQFEDIKKLIEIKCH